MARHLAPTPPSRLVAGWALGLSTIGLLVVLVVSLASDPPSTTDTSVGIFGAAARPGTFGGVTTQTLPPTTTTLRPTTTPPPSVTSLVPPTATTEPVTTTTTLAPIVLAEDGLTVVDLGAAYEDASEIVRARLGPPDEDTGWIRASSDLGICPGTQVRMLRWSSLRLLFSDGPTEFGEEGRHFFYFSQSTVRTEEVIDLRTDQGIGLESTVDELRTAYGSDLEIDSSLEFGVTFFVTPTGPGLLSGTLTNSGPDGLVTSLGGGFGCGL